MTGAGKFLHIASRSVTVAVCAILAAAFLVQNSYQIPSVWLRVLLLAGACFLGFRFSGPAVAGFFLILPLAGFVHLRLGLENSLIDTLLAAIILGAYGGQMHRDQQSPAPPQAPVLLSQTLILLLFSSLIGLSFSYPTGFALYRAVFTQPFDQLDPMVSFKAGSSLILALALFELALARQRDGLAGKRLFTLLAVQTGSILALAAIQLFYHYPLPRLPGLFSPFADIHSFAGYVLLLAVFFGVMALRSRGLMRWSSLALFLVLLAGVGLSNSRTAWVSLVLGGLFPLIHFTGWRKTAYTAAGLACALGLSLLLFSAKTQDYGDTLSQSMKNNLIVRVKNLLSLPGDVLAGRKGGEVETVNARFRLWERAVELGGQSPLTGWGPGAFYRLSAQADDAWPPSPAQASAQNTHNLYLQWLAELGFPGLALMLALLLRGPAKTISTEPPNENGRETPMGKALAFALIAYAVSCLAGHHLIINTQQYLIFFLLAAISAEHDPPRPGLAPGLLAGVLVLAGLHVAIGINTAPLSSYGLYPEEWEQGSPRRWTMRAFSMPVRVDAPLLLLDVRGSLPVKDGQTQTLTLYLDGEHLDTIPLDPGREVHLCYRLDSSPGRQAILSGRLSGGFNPSSHGIGGDNRDLGGFLSGPRFLPEAPGTKAGPGGLRP